ncbi:carbamate kinase [Streptacidiphilus sp. PB12-B1b]|uniref:carbamate kinase n=1 Tax=Streptacidiphilus sp. PB12-B1b TaxID=2705012 RepID=UPI0015FD67CE|nr:carbamate kinase [Streptacidiphilus sp. PB12-B1b]QMU78197.1 carbamate kinase [Streptacidiphilus sp. PB12-B1b]
MRIVAALGGNALLQRGEHPDATVQEAHIHQAATTLAELALAGHELVVTHGNGPQIGLLALESAADPALAAPYPLDVLGAQTQGMIGTLLVRELRNRLPDRDVVALVTHTQVDPADPAFQHPTKFIGQTYTRARAEQLTRDRGWTTAPDGDDWRRVVASPLPRSILEAATVRSLVAAGTVVVCAGGGGIPVTRNPNTGLLHGCEAVVDKDRTAALLAGQLDADALLILTDVAHVFTHYGTRRARALLSATPAELRALARELPEGSMRPKAEAAAAFVEDTGGIAGIGPLDDALGILLGTTGTLVRPDRQTSRDGAVPDQAPMEVRS